MILDNKGKLFGKVSIVDLLVVVLVIVGIAGVFFTYSKIKGGEVLTENQSLLRQDDTLDMLEVKMRLEEVRDVTVNSIHVGDDVYDNETNKFLGEIARVETEPATRIITDFSGQAFETDVPERYDVVMVVNIPGKRTEGGYHTANNIQLVYGSSFEIKTPTIQTTPVIEGITATPANAD